MMNICNVLELINSHKGNNKLCAIFKSTISLTSNEVYGYLNMTSPSQTVNIVSSTAGYYHYIFVNLI